jgi:hypothetical protein
MNFELVRSWEGAILIWFEGTTPTLSGYNEETDISEGMLPKINTTAAQFWGSILTNLDCRSLLGYSVGLPEPTPSL